MSLKKIRVFIVLPLLLFLLCVSLILLTNALVQRPAIQKYVIERISERTGFRIQTRSIELNLWRGPGLFVNDLEASSEALKVSLTSRKVRLIFDAGQLMRGRFVPVKILVDQPKLALPRAFGKRAPAQKRAKKTEWPAPFRLPGLELLSLNGGQVQLKDRPFKLMGINLDIRPRGGDPGTLVVNGAGDMHFEGKKAFFRMQTVLSHLSESDRSPFIDMTMDADDVPLTWIPWPAAIEMKEGSFNAKLSMAGNIDEALTLKGLISARSTRFSLSNDQKRKDFILPELRLDFRSLVKEGEIRVPSLLFKTPEVMFDVAMTLDLAQRQNPFLDLRIKSSIMRLDTFKTLFPHPVLPTWLENELLPLFSKADIQIHRLFLKGRMKQFEHIRLPQNRSVLSMIVSCKDFEMNHPAMTGPLKGRSAQIALDQGDLTISGVTATFGGSAIQEAGLRMKEVYENHSPVEISVNGSFMIQDLIKQTRADRMPGNIRNHLDRLQNINGSMTCNARILYRPDWERPVIESGRFAFRDCSFHEKALVYPLHVHTAEVLFQDKDQPRFSGKGRWGRSTFDIKGLFSYGGKGVQLEQADITAGLDPEEAVHLFPYSRAWDLAFRGLIPFQASIERKGDFWSSRGTCDFRGVFLETGDLGITPPGDKVHMDFQVDLTSNGKMAFHRIHFQANRSTLILSGDLDLEEQDTLHLKISTPNFAVRDLGIRLKKAPFYAKGNLRGNVVIRASRGNPAATRVNGRMVGEDLFFVTKAMPSPVSDLHFKMDFLGKGVSIPSWRMRLGGSPLHLRGELNGWDGLKGEMTVISEYLKAEDVIPTKVSFLPFSPAERSRTGLPQQQRSALGLFMGRSDINLNVSLDRGHWRDMEWGPVKAVIALRGKEVFIKESRIFTPHGTIQLKGRRTDGETPSWRISTRVLLNGQPVGDLMKVFKIEEEYVTGKLDMDALFITKGRTREALLKGLRGFINIHLKEGRLKKSNTMIKVLNYMSLQKILKEIPPDMSKEGFYYESIRGYGVIEEGVIHTADWVMKSPAINAVASGSITIPSGTLDYNLGIQPLGTVDALVSRIPLIGYILTGEDKKFLTYYFEVKGPIGEAEVKYIPFKNLGKGVTDAMKRLFMTPVRLFNEIPKPSDNGNEPGLDLLDDD